MTHATTEVASLALFISERRGFIDENRRKALLCLQPLVRYILTPRAPWLRSSGFTFRFSLQSVFASEDEKKSSSIG